MEIIKMLGDGNCLFRALAHQINELFHLTFDHAAIRRDLARYVNEHHQDLNIELAINIQDETGRSRYLKSLYNDGIWAGEEVIIAAANYYIINVNVHQKDCMLTYRPEKPAEPVGDINIFFENNHYDSLILEPDSLSNGQSPIRAQSITQTETQISVNSPEDVADDTGYTLIRTKSSYIKKYLVNSLSIATWNVRGTSSPVKKSRIDHELALRNIHVAAIQETKMTSGIFESKNYTWHLSGVKTTAHRGLAILISKNHNITLEKTITDKNVMYASLKTLNEKNNYVNWHIITAHIPSNNQMALKSFNNLRFLIRNSPKNRNTIILGDFNSHIGYVDTKKLLKKRHVGNNLFHEYNNPNGDILIDTIENENLLLETSTARPSCKTTWKSGKNTSQIDHIISTNPFNPRFKFIKGEWAGKRNTISDHKLIWGETLYTETNNTPTTQENQSPKTPNNKQPGFNHKQFNYEALSNIPTRMKYQSGILSRMPTSNQNKEDDNPSMEWESITEAIRSAARESLNIRFMNSKPIRIATANLQKAKFLRKKYPTNAKHNRILKDCRAKLQKAKDEDKKKTCEMFFSDLQKKHPSKRMQIIYLFYRDHKMDMKRKKKLNYIPMSKWELELKESEGPRVPLLPDEDTTRLGSPPTMEDVEDIIKKMRNRTAPGEDQIVIELFKALPPKMIEEITKHLQQAFLYNITPDSWNRTVQVPIPKSTNPKLVNDYRRISICNNIYRIYANFLLDRLDSLIEQPGNYQAAFLQNRSTDDHIFTLRRLLDEEWREDKRLYVMAIDLEKAFDTVDLTALRDILLSRTNIALTNRIVKVCMNEYTSIKWLGQQTSEITKGKGVKQGCPLSPRLFTILIDDVLKTLEEEVSGLKLNQDDAIQLPIILSFADDLILLSNDFDKLEEIMQKIKVLLYSVGLKVNNGKTKILIRDPFLAKQPQFITVDGVALQPLEEIKYLGTYITSGLCRKNTIRNRCKQAEKNGKALIQFVKEAKMDWQTVRTIYKMVIVPGMLYGLKVAALTKANRSRLRRYERLILWDLLQHARDKPPTRKAKDVLQGKTITKRLKCHRICYYGHVLRRERPHLLHAALKYQARKKKVGRPIYTWKDSLTQSLATYNKTTDEWVSLAPHRDIFKAAAYEALNESETDSNDETSDYESHHTAGSET